MQVTTWRAGVEAFAPSPAAARPRNRRSARCRRPCLPRPARARARARGAARAATPPRLDRAIEREAEFALRLEPDRIEAIAGVGADRRARRGNPPRRNAPSMKRSCSAVPQRTSAPCCGSRQNQATSARSSSCCARLMRASGGISNERNSTRPSRPVGPSGENSLSMQISARWVLPVTSTRRLRNSRSTSHGRGASPSPGAGTCDERDLELVEQVLPRLVDARRLAGRPDEQAGEQIGQRRMPLPIEDQALEQIGPAQERAVGRASAPPSTTWLPPPVPVWRPSIMNLSVPSRH